MHMQHTSAPSRTLMWTPEKLIANKQVLAGGPSAVRMIRFENITTRVQHSYFLSSSISLGPTRRLVLQVIQSVWLCSMVHTSSSRSRQSRRLVVSSLLPCGLSSPVSVAHVNKLWRTDLCFMCFALITVVLFRRGPTPRRIFYVKF
jgi:hypothetical protein